MPSLISLLCLHSNFFACKVWENTVNPTKNTSITSKNLGESENTKTETIYYSPKISDAKNSEIDNFHMRIVYEPKNSFFSLFCSEGSYTYSKEACEEFQKRAKNFDAKSFSEFQNEIEINWKIQSGATLTLNTNIFKNHKKSYIFASSKQGFFMENSTQMPKNSYGVNYNNFFAENNTKNSVLYFSGNSNSHNTKTAITTENISDTTKAIEYNFDGIQELFQNYQANDVQYEWKNGINIDIDTFLWIKKPKNVYIINKNGKKEILSLQKHEDYTALKSVQFIQNQNNNLLRISIRDSSLKNLSKIIIEL